MRPVPLNRAAEHAACPLSRAIEQAEEKQRSRWKSSEEVHYYYKQQCSHEIAYIVVSSVSCRYPQAQPRTSNSQLAWGHWDHILELESQSCRHHSMVGVLLYLAQPSRCELHSQNSCPDLLVQGSEGLIKHVAVWQQGAEVDVNVLPSVLEPKYQQVHIGSHICQLYRNGG